MYQLSLNINSSFFESGVYPWSKYHAHPSQGGFMGRVGEVKKYLHRWSEIFREKGCGDNRYILLIDCYKYILHE